MEIIRYANQYRISQFRNNKINFFKFMRCTDEKLNDERNHTWKENCVKDIPIKIIIPDEDETK